jgi:hypothetical protein
MKSPWEDWQALRHNLRMTAGAEYQEFSKVSNLRVSYSSCFKKILLKCEMKWAIDW